MAKKNKKSKIPGIIIILIMTLSVLLYMNFKKEEVSIIDIPRYMIIGKEKVFVVYEDKLALILPFEIQLKKDQTIADLDKLKDYTGIKKGVNKLLPEKVEIYKVVKKGEVKINVAHKYIVPEVMIGDKRFILTSSLNSLFMENYYKVNNKTEKNIIIDVLNGNGKPGYAGKTGRKIEAALSYKYNAANYERESEYSYIINKDLNPEELEELVMSLDEKYIKIKSELDLPTLANAVIVLGKENNIQTKINIYGGEKEEKDIKKMLEKSGYKNIYLNSQKGSLTVVEYNSKDYYIAYKIAKKLGIKNMVKNNENKEDTINIYINISK